MYIYISPASFSVAGRYAGLQGRYGQLIAPSLTNVVV